MALDEQDIRWGLRFIVGKWEPDYVVSAFSNNLEHIPASEFKSDDGRDFSALKLEFFEDHRLTAAAKGEWTGTWEQTDRYSYQLHFDGIPEDDFVKAVGSLEVMDGNLVFSMGFLAVSLKKTADGVVTEPPDIGDLPDSGETGIVGRYAVAKMIGVVGDDFGLFTREEIEAELKRKIAAGEAEEEEASEALNGFGIIIEFAEDHLVYQWTPIPNGVSEDEIKAALEAGEIKAVKDGAFCMDANEWKAVAGEYYYNTNEERELFGEKQSPWDKLEFDENGLLPFASGMFLLRKL